MLNRDFSLKNKFSYLTIVRMAVSSRKQMTANNSEGVGERDNCHCSGPCGLYKHYGNSSQKVKTRIII